jgi:hypothetical protein
MGAPHNAQNDTFPIFKGNDPDRQVPDDPGLAFG